MFFDSTGYQSFLGDDPFLKKIIAHAKAGIKLQFSSSFSSNRDKKPNHLNE